MTRFDIAIVGGGIVGLATAEALARRFPHARLVLIEKENGWARHQSGRNSGVIHSGLYYRPGSLKARLCRAGARSMVEFCREHGIAHAVSGKLVVAARAGELARLEALGQRGLANGLEVRQITPEEAREREPHVRCVAALYVPSTGIADYRAVCARLAHLARAAGADLRTATELLAIEARADALVLETSTGPLETGFLVNCGGLWSDRIARMGGTVPPARIVPFRGEYYELVPERRALVRGLIYPVPDPSFPFLGVHFTRMVDGSVHAGPNAVLALRRDGYLWRDVRARDALETLGYRGFWRLAGRHAAAGAREVLRSLSKAVFVRSLRRLVPEIRATDLRPCAAGVRAQALAPDGALVDDFLIVPGPRAVHVLNAPSPAATASLEIAKAIAAHVPEPARRAVAAAGAGALTTTRG